MEFVKHSDNLTKDIKTELKLKEEEDLKLEAALQSDLTEVTTLKTKQHQQQEERVKSINARMEFVLKSVNDVADSFISNFQTQTKSNCDKLQDAIDDISTKLEKLKDHKKVVKRISSDTDDLSALHASQKIVDFDRRRKPFPDLTDIEFTHGKVNTNQLKFMFGGTAAEMDKQASLQTAQVPSNMAVSTYDFVGTYTVKRQDRELVLESTFKHSELHVHEMCNGPYGMTWMRCHGGRELALIDKQGQEQLTLTFDSHVNGMSTVYDNTLLICGVEDRDIKQIILPSGKVTSVFSIGKLYPYHVCKPPSGDLYVTVLDSIDYKVTIDSERALVRYSPLGREKGRARYDRRGDPLFVGPFRVRFSNTEDVIGVINNTDEDNNHLVLLNADLTLRLRYLGNGKVVLGEEKFDTTTYKPETKYAIRDFIFHSFENIIICEYFSRCVRLLSKDCVPMCTLLQTQEHIPMSMTMNGDEVWLGFIDGTVKVYKYK